MVPSVEKKLSFHLRKFLQVAHRFTLDICSTIMLINNFTGGKVTGSHFPRLYGEISTNCKLCNKMVCKFNMLKNILGRWWGRGTGAF